MTSGPGPFIKKFLVRWFDDARLRLETLLFRHVTVISQSLAQKLRLSPEAHVLPLGAAVISISDKTFDKLHLLYVGTLFNRNIDITIHGFKRFYDEFGTHIPISYTIIGDGPNNEAQFLRELTSQYNISDVVKVLGQIPHTNLGPYFDFCNVGVAYVTWPIIMIVNH